MPLPRPRSRSKPRSPVINSLLPSSLSSPRTPTFYPPSHYAAAAGLSYPPLPRADIGSDSRQLRDSGGDFQPAEQDTSETSSMDSTHATSSHLGAVSRFLQRSPSRSSLCRSNSKGSKSDKEKDDKSKRQSQLGDIPSLEAQLLPSLNDTVSRMTHPPTSGYVEGHLVGARDATSPPTQNRDSRQWSRDTSSVPPSANMMTPNHTSALRMNAHLAPPAAYWSPQSSNSPSLSTPSTISLRTPIGTPSAGSIDPPKSSTTTPKRPLKSALRTPSTPVSSTPKLYDELPASYSVVRSLRTAKNLATKVPQNSRQADSETV